MERLPDARPNILRELTKSVISFTLRRSETPIIAPIENEDQFERIAKELGFEEAPPHIAGFGPR